MKVLQVLPALDGGGVECGTLEVAQALVKAGHDSWVLSAGGGLVTELEQAGSRHKTWDIGKKTPLNIFQVRKVRAWLQSEKFDIVHLRSRMPAWVIYLAWRKMDPKTRPRLVSSVHGLHSVSAYSEIVACGEKVIAISKQVESYLRDNYPKVDMAKVELIYEGINSDIFNPNLKPDAAWLKAWRDQYPQLKNQFVICLPGRLTRLKGHHELFKLLVLLNQRGICAHALVVGGEDPKRQSYAQELYQEVEDLGLQQQVIFTGNRRDIHNIYTVSDVILSLSTKPESFGRTVVEALSLGRPVVGYDHGGVGEILTALFEQGKVPLLDTEVLADKVEAIYRQKVAMVKLNVDFTLKRMQQQTLALYAELLES